MVKQCGPQLALVIPDARTERTKAQVCDGFLLLTCLDLSHAHATSPLHPKGISAS